MPGKLCNDNRTLRTPLPLSSQAFCDGRKANADGAARTTNPWDGSAANDQDRENELDWDQGWDHYQSNPNDKGCCQQ